MALRKIRLTGLSILIAWPFHDANPANAISRPASRHLPWTIVLQTRRSAPLDVNSAYGVHETTSRGDTAGRNHLQCAHLDESSCPSGRAIPYGGRRDRSRFD